MADFNWTCPHCSRDQVVGASKVAFATHHIGIEGTADGSLSYGVQAIGCANKNCKKLSVEFGLWRDKYSSGAGYVVDQSPPLLYLHVIPRGSAKPQPDYIPAPIIEDYQEACLITQDSPKAAATLARRCLQGMIRDFCGISRKTLYLELNELRKAVDENRASRGVTHESVEAIDHVRTVGNIGAHMESDIDLIVPVEPDEAQILIGLIEMLFVEWYVERFKRQSRLADIAAVAEAKRHLLAGKAAEPIAEARLLEGGAAALLADQRDGV